MSAEGGGRMKRLSQRCAGHWVRLIVSSHLAESGRYFVNATTQYYYRLTPSALFFVSFFP